MDSKLFSACKKEIEPFTTRQTCLSYMQTRFVPFLELQNSQIPGLLGREFAAALPAAARHRRRRQRWRRRRAVRGGDLGDHGAMPRCRLEGTSLERGESPRYGNITRIYKELRCIPMYKKGFCGILRDSGSSLTWKRWCIWCEWLGVNYECEASFVNCSWLCCHALLVHSFKAHGRYTLCLHICPAFCTRRHPRNSQFSRTVFRIGASLTHFTSLHDLGSKSYMLHLIIPQTKDMIHEVSYSVPVEICFFVTLLIWVWTLREVRCSFYLSF